MTSLKNKLPSADTLAISQHAKTSVQFGSCARAGEFIDDRSCRERAIIADRGASHFLRAAITAYGDDAFRGLHAAADGENAALSACSPGANLAARITAYGEDTFRDLHAAADGENAALRA
jgi:hypothetical protein